MAAPYQYGQNPPKEPSLRQLTSAIRHLDPMRARKLVELFARPVVSDGVGVRYDRSDPVTATSHGWLSVAAAIAHSRPELCVGHYCTHLYLHELLRLPLSVARELARHQGHLYLDKLVSITDSVAKELGHHTGGGLSLNNLRSLSVASALALGYHCGELSLNRLRRLEPHAAFGLARNSHELYLGGIRKLSSETASVLSLHGGALFLDGLTKLSKRLAVHLARHMGKLHLHGVTKLSDAAAQALGKRTGYLCLQGVERLSPVQAQYLAGHKGPLLFSRLYVNDAVATALARHEGALAVPTGRCPSLVVLELLVQHGGQLLLQDFEDISEREARVLASQTPWRGIEGISGLFLDRVKHISPPVASILATHRAGELSLRGVALLTEETAVEIVKHPILCLDGVRSVTDRVAAILATHSGAVLSLKGLDNVSGAALAKLRENPSIELPRRFYGGDSPPISLPPSAAVCPDKEKLFRTIEQIASQGEVALGNA
jgi:hypothetical protein